MTLDVTNMTCPECGLSFEDGDRILVDMNEDIIRHNPCPKYEQLTLGL